MSDEIIVIEQLPVIKQQLQTIKADVTKRVNDALSLVCTKETVAVVKEARAELTKEFKAWEDKRKEVKNAIMKPYNDFDEAYKDCITDVFKAADSDLKSKIDSVENELKEQRYQEVFCYFEELCQANNLDFVTFENTNINITLSASMKSLKKQAKDFVDRICDDLTLIATQEHKDEILYFYKKQDGISFLDVSKSIAFVIDKHRVIEAEKAKEAERQAQIEVIKAVESKVDEIVPPTIEPPKEDEPILTVRFTVKGTRTQLKALKEFLNNGGYDYE